MRLLFAGLLILCSSTMAMAQSFYLYDFLFHIQNVFNSSKSIEEIADQMPGSHEVRTKYLFAMRAALLDQKPIPHIRIVGKSLVVDLRPKLQMDFSDLQDRVVIVNGTKIKLDDPHLLKTFRKVYRVEKSMSQLLLESIESTSLAFEGDGSGMVQYQLGKSFVQQNKTHWDFNILDDSGIDDWSGSVLYAAWHKLTFCGTRNVPCTYTDFTKALNEQLATSGVKTFECVGTRLTAFQKGSTEDNPNPVRYVLTYNGGDLTEVSTDNMTSVNGNLLHCTYRVKGANATSSQIDCKPQSGKVNSIGGDSLLPKLRKCCTISSCTKSLYDLKNKTNVLNDSKTNSVP